MPILDVSPVDAGSPTIMLATNSAKPRGQGLYGTVGVCRVVGNQPSYKEANFLNPDSAASEIFTFKEPKFPYDRRDVIADMLTAKVSLLETPRHGRIANVDTNGSIEYVPNRGYIGPDKVVFLVERILGQKVKVVQYIKVAKQEVLPPLPPEPAEKLAVYRKKYCPRDSWLISGHSEADRFSSDVESVNAWHQSASLSALIATASQSLTGFQDLAGSSVGQTTGTNAAGHGW